MTQLAPITGPLLNCPSHVPEPYAYIVSEVKDMLVDERAPVASRSVHDDPAVLEECLSSPSSPRCGYFLPSNFSQSIFFSFFPISV